MNRRLRAFLLDWLIWAYIPVGLLYLFRDYVSDLSFAIWLYLGAVATGALVAWVMERSGVSLGEKVAGLAPEEPLEDRGKTKRPPWHKTQLGWTGAILGAVTLVLGWNITEINLYYVFTRADKMANMTDLLVRPYWPVFGALIEKLIETIFLALMATVIAVPIAAVISFFAARNLMYGVTSKLGTFVAATTLALVGGWLGLRLVDLMVSPFVDSMLDIKLVAGILNPILLVAGMVFGGILGHRVMSRFLADRGGIAKALSVALFTAIGLAAAYVLASAVAAVFFGASWRYFVQEVDMWAGWPYVILAVGTVAGFVFGLRQEPDDDFEIGKWVYNGIRFILNTTRSIEPFVWALIFVTWFRLGPFPGMVALMVHSVAALGKLYSEQIEGIDPGPLEAVRAAGANELQTIVYAVVPQIIPPFISFTIYRWDINVRMSTIIGLVGGGGVGQLLFQYQNLGQWRKVSVAVILIVAVVMTLDNVSARIREKIL